MDKITRKMIVNKYDELCTRMDIITHSLNPCHLTIKKIGDEPCVASCAGYASDSEALCCEPTGAFTRCKHWKRKSTGDAGCSVKSLRCKIWFCSSLKQENMEITQFEVRSLRRYDWILGNTATIIINQEHATIIKEMRIWLFDRYFRMGKERAIEWSYKYRDQIIRNMQEEIKNNI